MKTNSVVRFTWLWNGDDGAGQPARYSWQKQILGQELGFSFGQPTINNIDFTRKILELWAAEKKTNLDLLFFFKEKSYTINAYNFFGNKITAGTAYFISIVNFFSTGIL